MSEKEQVENPWQAPYDYVSGRFVERNPEHGEVIAQQFFAEWDKDNLADFEGLWEIADLWGELLKWDAHTAQAVAQTLLALHSRAKPAQNTKHRRHKRGKRR